MTGQPTSILVVQLTRLGDFLQTTPLLAALKQRFPSSTLSVLVNAPQADLARNNTDIDEVIPVSLTNLDRLARDRNRPFPGKIRLAHELLAPLAERRFDQVINLNSSNVAALLSLLPTAGNRSGPSLAPDRRHLTRPAWTGFIMNLMSRRDLIRFNLVDLLTCYAGVESRPTGKLSYPFPPPGDAAAHLPGRTLDRPLIGLQLASRHISRQWPIEYFARLAANLIHNHGASIVLLGMESEKAHGREFLEHLEGLDNEAPQRVIDLMGKTSLPELGAVVASLDLLVTGDTGTMHLAASAETPILALFIGPALCHETGPYGEGHLILQVRTECSPCTEGKASCTDCFCRRLITPNMALQAAALLLNQDQTARPVPGGGWNGVSLLRSEMDDFGVVYKPVLPEPLNPDSILALAYREAGRRFIRPAYRPDAGTLSGYLKGFGPAGAETAREASELSGFLVKLLHKYEQGLPTGAFMNECLAVYPGLEPLSRILAGQAFTANPASGRVLIEDMLFVFRMLDNLSLSRETSAEAATAAQVLQAGQSLENRTGK